MTSTINDTLPTDGSFLDPSVVRARFTEAKNDINALSTTLSSFGISKVALLNDIRSLDKTQISMAQTAGYWSKGDGGAGQYWYDSTDTSSSDNGGSVIVASDGGRWKLINGGSVSIRQFGAKCDGTTDDTAKIQAALTAFTGKIVNWDGKPYIATSITLPTGTTLKGPLTNVGEVSSHTYNLNGTIFLNSAATINIGDFASVEGGFILNSALKSSLPFANDTVALAALAAYAGTALTGTGQDAQVRDVWVGGFAQGYYSTGKERTKIQRLNIDCTNGVWIDASYDIARVEDVHCWAFITTHQGALTNVTYRRQGSAFKTTTHFDGGMFINCFSYGWDIGYDIQAKESTSLISCYADGPGLGAGQVGFKFTVDADMIRVVGGGSSGQDTGVYLNTNITSTTGVVALTGLSMWGNHAHIVSDQHHILQVSDCLLRDTNGGTNRALTLSGTVTGDTLVSGCVFYSNTPYSIAAGIPDRRLSLKDNIFDASTDSVGERHVGDNGSNNLNYSVYSSGTGGINYIVNKARGTATIPTVAQDNDITYSFTGKVFDGTSFSDISNIRSSSRGAPSVGSSAGAIIFGTTSTGSATISDRLILNEDGHLYPTSDNAYFCGVSVGRWQNINSVNLTLTPPASVTPANNGEVTFQLTDNTHLVIKVKGSDGTVRSNTLTLA
jgi:hypothetical protein